MNEKIKLKFPKGFFQKKRLTISAGEALKDTTPFKWSNKNSKQKTVKIKKA